MKKILSNQNEKGITLIALVVTIVVLLVIAGTSLDMLLGDNGIIRQTQEAKQQTEISDEKETIKLAYNALKIGDINKAITAQEMEDEINRTKGANTVEVTGNGTLTVKFLESNRMHEINATTGKIKDDIVDIETILETATKHGEQVETDDIGIAEDGTIVNLDLWYYRILDGETIDLSPPNIGSYMSTPSYGYRNILKGEEIPLQEIEGEDGEKYYTIYGKIPMYIKIDGEIYIVKYMSGTFADISNLTIVPEIPSSVTDMYFTFYHCDNLTTTPEIPASVREMENTFSDCDNLTTVQKIQPGVTNMYYTFSYCDNLTTVPEIPASVTDMVCTFSGCTNLTTAPEIPSSVTDMSNTFSGCTNLTTAPEIPSSVTDMSYTFYGCSNLSGTLTINANPTESYYCCLERAAINSTLKLNGTSTMLNQILATKSDNSNITIEGQ